MDLGSLLNLVLTIALAGIGGIVWLIRLEGKMNVESEKRSSLHDRMLAQEARVNGFEERVYAKLDTIEELLRSKADK